MFLPFRIWADTLFYARLALRAPGAVPWLGGTWFGDDVPLGGLVAPNAWAAWADAVLGVFGNGEAGLLALSAIPSAVAILAAAWLARELGGREAALAATVLASFSGWAIVHGRWGYTSAALVPLALGAGAALVRADRLRADGWALAGGLLAGATVHTYPAAWPLLAALAPVLVVRVVKEPGRRRAALLAIGGLLVPVLLLLPAWVGRPDRLGGRAVAAWAGASVKDTAVPGGPGLAGVPVRVAYNAWHYAALLAGNADPNPRHGLPDRPPLPALVGLLALGGAAAVWRRPNPGRGIVAALAVGGLLAGLASSPAAVPNTQRAALFLAVALVLAARGLAALPGSATGVLVTVGAAAIALVATDVRSVLGPWAGDARVEAAFLPGETEAGRLLSRLAPAPVVLERGATAIPVAVEALASAATGRPILAARRLPTEALAAGRLGPGSAFWILGRRETIARLEGFRVGRGIAPSPLSPDLVVVRAVRPGR